VPGKAEGVTGEVVAAEEGAVSESPINFLPMKLTRAGDNTEKVWLTPRG